MKTVIPEGVVRTLCRQCDMHCGVKVQIDGGRISGIRGDRGNPQNKGRICPKGPAAREMVYHPERLLKPLKRTGGSFVEISYAQAIEEIAGRIQDLRRTKGSRAVGVWTGEAVGFQQQADYARRFIHALGSPNYFSAESVCFASRYIASYLVQGFYCPVPDFAHADLIVLWGINPGVTHMPYMLRIKEAIDKGAKLVVIDPRRTEAVRSGDLHLKIIPGTDGALALAIARHLIETGAYDKDFIEQYATGFEAFRAYVNHFTLEYAAGQTGLSSHVVDSLFRLVAGNGSRVVHAPGISLEHQPNGVNTLRGIACLSGLSGAVDRKGGELWYRSAGLNRLTLYDTHPLPGIRPVGADEFPVLYEVRKECHSLSAMDYMVGNGAYPLKAMIMTGANPVLTNPNAAKTAASLGALDLFVVRDLFLTQTARLAHYVLPAASFLERSEIHAYDHLQRIVLTRKVLDTPEVTGEYTFWRDLANNTGIGAYFPWKAETEVNRWLLEPTGISVEELAAHPEGIPYAPLAFEKSREAGFPTESGKYELASGLLKRKGLPELPVYAAPPFHERPASEYPYVLMTGARKKVFYHSRFRNIDSLRRAGGEPEVEIHPQDAAELKIRQGKRLVIRSKIGSIVVIARVVGTEDILPGLLQMTHGWDQANVNLLTDDKDVDSISGLPNMKLVPVKIDVHF